MAEPLSLISGCMMEALKPYLEQKCFGCVEEIELDGDCEDFQEMDLKCESKQRTFLHCKAPEFFTLNLNWELYPSAKSILKLLVSVSYHLRASDLYEIQGGEDKLYSIRAMIVFSQNHYYLYVLQTAISGSQREQRWVCFNDSLVRIVPKGWPEVISECLMSCAYPTIIVYEAADEATASDAPYLFDDSQLKTWQKEAEKADENLFSDDNIQEQIRLFELHEQRMQGVDIHQAVSTGEGKYTVFWVGESSKTVSSETYDSFNLATSAFNRKLNCSRTLINENWEIKNSKSRSKKNKTDLKKIKEHINMLKT